MDDLDKAFKYATEIPKVRHMSQDDIDFENRVNEYLGNTGLQPIDTAPKNGTIVLSNLGFVRYIDKRHWATMSVREGWTECNHSGDLFSDSNNNQYICHPSVWVPVPDLINE